jgi:hypothetical protein
MTHGALEESFDRPEVEQLQVFTPLDHLLQPLETNGRGNVEKGSGKGRDRNPIAAPDPQRSASELREVEAVAEACGSAERL